MKLFTSSKKQASIEFKEDMFLKHRLMDLKVAYWALWVDLL